jgi:hypothetical protein
MGKIARSTQERANLKSERKVWLELAANIEQDDLAPFSQEP